MEEKNLYIISGCNGAGKTTASFTILPEIIECREIVNGALIFDNSYGKHELIAQKIEHEDILILDSEKFQQLKKYYEQQR